MFRNVGASYYCNRVEKSDLGTLEREKVCDTKGVHRVPSGLIISLGLPFLLLRGLSAQPARSSL